MDACINSNKAKLQHGKLHVYTFCKYFQAGQSASTENSINLSGAQSLKNDIC